MIVYIVYGFNILISIATSTICPTKQTGHLSNLLLSVILGVFDSDIAFISSSILSMSSSALFAILSPTEHIFCSNFHFYQMSDSILIILYCMSSQITPIVANKVTLFAYEFYVNLMCNTHCVSLIREMTIT